MSGTRVPRRRLQRLRAVHRWLALLLGVVFVLQGLTGSLVAIDESLDAWLDPQLAQAAASPQRKTLEELAIAFVDRIGNRPGSGVSQVGGAVFGFWPEPDPVIPSETLYQVARLHPVDARTLSQEPYGTLPRHRHSITLFIHSVHTSLAMGAVGKFFQIGVAAFLVLSAVLGTLLWWPRQQSLSAALKPSSVRRRALEPTLHRLLGIYFGWLLVLLAVTGIVLHFQSTLFAAIRPKSEAAAGRAAISLADAIGAVHRAVPEGGIRATTNPRTAQDVYRFSLEPEAGRFAGKTLHVFVDQYSGRVLRVRDFAGASFTEKVIMLLEPVHGGAVLGDLGHAIAFVAGLLPLTMLMLGVRSWRRRARQQAVDPAGQVDQSRR